MFKIIAVVGLCGVGKSEVTAQISVKFSAPVVYFGGLVIEELKVRGLDVTADNERIVREELRKNHGMGVMAFLSIPKLVELGNNNDYVIIDGLYSYSELKILKKKFQDNLKVLAVHSRKNLRYKRLSKRSIRPLTKEQVEERDRTEIENLEKAPPIAIADSHILNNRKLEELKVLVEAELETLF